MGATDWHTIYNDRFAGCRVLVTGGAGFIGSHLTEALIRLGAHVVVLDNLSGGRKSNLRPAQQIDDRCVDFIEGSILDSATLARCVKQCRYVFHQSALPSVLRSIKHPMLYEQVNVMGTLHVLQAAREAGVERVMFAASSSAYGDTQVLPKVETMAPLPRSPYAATKLAGEHLMRAYASCYQLDTVSLRYFNIFGPRQNTNSAYAGVIAAFAKSLFNGRHPVIHGDGEQSRDFTFVDNAVHANLLAASCNEPLGGEVINIGCGERVTINELAVHMARLIDRADLVATHEPARAGDVRHSLADLGRAVALIGYEPIVDFEQGLGAATEWYRQARPWSDDDSDQPRA